MSLSEILQTAGDTLKVIINGWIALSNAHPLLGIGSALLVAKIGIGLYKKLKP